MWQINVSRRSLTRRTPELKITDIGKLVKQLQVMRTGIVIKRAEAIQLIQAVDGKRYEKLEKCLHALLTSHADHWDWQQYEKYSIFSVKRGNIKTRLSTVDYSIANYFDNDPELKNKWTRIPWTVNTKQVPTEKNHWKSPLNCSA